MPAGDTGVAVPRYVHFQVQLEGISPPIWRRFLLSRESTFADLHEAIQLAGPWVVWLARMWRATRGCEGTRCGGGSGAGAMIGCGHFHAGNCAAR